MTDATWAIQISPKLPDGTLVNVRADTPEQLDVLLGYVQNKGADIASAVQALVAGAGVAGAFPGSTNVPTPQPAYQPQPEQGTWGNQGTQQQAPPAFAQQPAAPGATCVHGAMALRSGNKNGRDWSAYFCPTPKGTPNQCDPVWGKQ